MSNYSIKDTEPEAAPIYLVECSALKNVSIIASEKILHIDVDPPSYEGKASYCYSVERFDPTTAVFSISNISLKLVSSTVDISVILTPITILVFAHVVSLPFERPNWNLIPIEHKEKS